MKGQQNIKKATTKASARDRKRSPKMKVSGKSVFTVARLKNTTKK